MPLDYVDSKFNSVKPIPFTQQNALNMPLSKFASPISLPQKNFQQDEEKKQTNHNSSESSRTPINNLKNLSDVWVDPTTKIGDVKNQTIQRKKLLTQESSSLSVISKRITKSAENHIISDPQQKPPTFILRTNVHEELLLEQSDQTKLSSPPIIHKQFIREPSFNHMPTEPSEQPVNKD
jgi:hypothetical protein